jgi:hypothetical protein
MRHPESFPSVPVIMMQVQGMILSFCVQGFAEHLSLSPITPESLNMALSSPIVLSVIDYSLEMSPPHIIQLSYRLSYKPHVQFFAFAFGSSALG